VHVGERGDVTSDAPLRVELASKQITD
jgi:hypothetical protein